MSVQAASNGRKTPDQRRRSELAKIHVARQRLGMEDGAYRDMLERVAGVRSAAELSASSRAAVLEELKRLGFRDRPGQPRRAGKRPIAEGEQQAKIRALWLSLYHLGEVDDPSEAALAAFVRRMTRTATAPDGVAALQWLDAASANRAILSLRGWCERVGFAQPTAERHAQINSWRALARLDPADIGFAAKVGLIGLLWQRLGEAGAFTLAGPIFASQETWLRQRFGVAAPHFLQPQDADRAIEQLGKWLRRARAEKKGEDHGR